MSSEEYWNRNISEWGKFYLGISHSGESLKEVPPFVSAYKASIGRIEARLMKTKYDATMNFVQQSVTEDCVFADLGCGTGIFTLPALRQAASVIAGRLCGSSARSNKTRIGYDLTPSG